MILFKQATALTQHLLGKKNSEQSVGFVPTMGALHPGHLSLIEKAKAENDVAACSIFVNPTQFTNADDYKHYPVTIEKDIELLTKAGCDVLFLPSVEEIYPPGYQPTAYDLGQLGTVLEGQHRPGHFQGVCQVVERLLHIVQPHRLYLGQKDWQQCLVVRTLLRTTGLDKTIELITGPTLREPDGLAMSSRNLRLSAEQRQQANQLFKTLSNANQNWKVLGKEAVETKAIEQLTGAGFSVDYFSIVDADTLLPSSNGQTPQIALVAAHLDKVRLIDNLPLN